MAKFFAETSSKNNSFVFLFYSKFKKHLKIDRLGFIKCIYFQVMIKNQLQVEIWTI